MEGGVRAMRQTRRPGARNGRVFGEAAIYPAPPLFRAKAVQACRRRSSLLSVSDAYEPDLDEPNFEMNQEWLKTPEGREWLDSDNGMRWLGTTAGRWWSQGQDAYAWYEEQARAGWAAYFRGDVWPTFSNMFTPDNAPKLGTRVRLTDDRKIARDETVASGELAVVASVGLAPIGSVQVELRTVDGRRCVVLGSDQIESA
jgi:hypothetical protein